MRMTKFFEKDLETNKKAFICFEITCKDEREMDIVREIFEKHTIEVFGTKLHFDRCYGDEQMNYDIIGFSYEENEEKKQVDAMKLVWSKTKETYKNMKKQGLLK